MKWQIGALCPPYKNGDNCGQFVEELATEQWWDHPNYDEDTFENDFTIIKLKGRSSVDPVPIAMSDDSSVNFNEESKWICTSNFSYFIFICPHRHEYKIKTFSSVSDEAFRLVIKISHNSFL